MANLTLTIDDEVLRRSRIRALEQGTSVNALVRDYLDEYARDSSLEATLEEILLIADQQPAARANTSTSGRGWTRDELYDRPHPGTFA